MYFLLQALLSGPAIFFPNTEHPIRQWLLYRLLVDDGLGPSR